MGNPHELKQLQTKLHKAQKELDEAREEVRMAQRKETSALRVVNELQKQIETVEEKGITVTEHALLRYFERVLGYDLEAIQRGLLTPEVRALAKTLPNGRIPSVGCRLVFKDGIVVTLEV